jgi:hypothetical protein
MRSLENLIRQRRFGVNQTRRHLLQLEIMMADFDRMAHALDIQIVSEEKKTGISDLNHFAYPTFAKAARVRLDNIANSKRGLSEQRIASEALLAQAEAELAKAENLESREGKPPPTSIPRQGT